jgi:glycosyltransferase involved in cell wall biosynthesis
MTPRLSVIMPAYNVAGYIVDALDSLRRQTFDDFEIVIVDDGSTDATRAVIDRFTAAHPDLAPRIVVIGQANAGPSAARNRALDAAQARYVGFLDADDRWQPDKARQHVALLDARPDVDLTFSWFRFVADDGSDLQEVYAPRPRVLNGETLLRKNIIHTGTVVARRTAIERAGRFDPSLSRYEDLDLWLRVAALRPGNLCCINEVLTDYRRRPDQLTRDWRGMNAAWEQVLENYRKVDPHCVARIENDARGNQLEYCSSLAYNAGELGEARRLILRAWRHSGWRFLGRATPLLMTAICLATLLPRPIQIKIGQAYRIARGTWHALTLQSARNPS